MTSPFQNDPPIQALIGLVAGALDPFTGPHGAPMTAIPEGWELKDLAHLQPAPARRKGHIQADTQESFLAIWADEALDQSRIYLSSPPRVSLTAVFNDSKGDALGWRDHLCTYSMPFSDEWDTWTKEDAKLMSQVEFAHFVEKNLPDFVSPDGASMMELAQSLEANKGVAFKSGVRLGNGAHQLRFEETIEARAGAKGDMNVPEIFKIGIPVFRGGSLYEVACRLRYRINGPTLVLGYEIDRGHKIVEHALKKLADQIEEATSRKIIYGAPASK